MLLEVLTPAPDSMEPPCPVFDRCGGCTWQRLTPARQGDLKTDQVRSAIRRIGGFKDVPVAPLHPSPRPFRYRNKIDLAFSAPARSAGEPFTLGLHSWRGDHSVVDVPACLLISDRLQHAVDASRRHLAAAGLRAADDPVRPGPLVSLIARENSAGDQVLVNLVVATPDPPAGMRALADGLRRALGDRFRGLSVTPNGQPGVAPESPPVTLAGEGHLDEVFSGYRVQVPADAFLQVHPEMARVLGHRVGELASIRRGAVVYDLYCGVGPFTWALADRAGAVLGCEGHAAAARAAAGAARDCGAGHVQILNGDVADLGGRLPIPGTHRHPDVIILDPPRAGLSKRARKRVGGAAGRRLLYVSCDPAALARDAAWFRSNSRWRLRSVEPFDLFPQTRHVECIAVFEPVDSVRGR